METVTCILYVAAFVVTLISLAGKMPLSIAVLLLTVAGLLSCYPK